MLYREAAAVTCENVKKRMNAVCDGKAEDSHVKARDIGLCSGCHAAIKLHEIIRFSISSIFSTLICKMCIRNLQNARNSTDVWNFFIVLLW